MTTLIIDKKQRTANIGFAKWRVKCFYDSLVQGSSSVFQMNIRAKNPPPSGSCKPLPASVRTTVPTKPNERKKCVLL